MKTILWRIRESVSIAELEYYDLVLPAKGLQARNAFDIICEGSYHHLKVRMESNDVNILLKLVKQSGMITILSETTIYNEEGFSSIPIDLRIREMEGMYPSEEECLSEAFIPRVHPVVARIECGK